MLFAYRCVGCDRLMKQGTDHLCHDCYLKGLTGQSVASDDAQATAEANTPPSTPEESDSTEADLPDVDSAVSARVHKD